MDYKDFIKKQIPKEDIIAAIKHGFNYETVFKNMEDVDKDAMLKAFKEVYPQYHYGITVEEFEAYNPNRNSIESKIDDALLSIDGPDKLTNLMEYNKSNIVLDLINDTAENIINSANVNDIANYIQDNTYSVPEYVEELEFLNVSADDVRNAIYDSIDNSRDYIGNYNIDNNTRDVVDAINNDGYISNVMIDDCFKDAYLVDGLETLDYNERKFGYDLFKTVAAELVKEDILDFLEEQGIDKYTTLDEMRMDDVERNEYELILEENELGGN